MFKLLNPLSLVSIVLSNARALFETVGWAHGTGTQTKYLPSFVAHNHGKMENVQVITGFCITRAIMEAIILLGLEGRKMGGTTSDLIKDSGEFDLNSLSDKGTGLYHDAIRVLALLLGYRPELHGSIYAVDRMVSGVQCHNDESYRTRQEIDAFMAYGINLLEPTVGLFSQETPEPTMTTIEDLAQEF